MLRSAARASRRRALLALVIALLVAAAGRGLAAAEARLTDAETRGKQIYLKGTSGRDGTIDAVVGDEGLTLPGSALPCASCHGADGRGRPEGGVLPSDIRWSHLVKTYGHVHPDGSRHPAYDEDSFAAALRAGVDPAGNGFDRAMPLYAMADTEMADLVAYLKRLETDTDPGVEPDRVTVATLLPLDGPGAATGRAMAQVLHAHFADVNARGGVFGRRIDLLAIPAGDSPEQSVDGVRRAMAAEQIFAFVGAYTVGVDAEILGLLREDRVPLVGPFTLDPGDAFLDSSAFYLYPGFSEQARALADRALEAAGKAATIAVVGPARGNVDAPVAAVQDQLRHRDGSEPVVVRYATGEFDAAAIRDQAADATALIFLGSQAELETLLGTLAQADVLPAVYALSAFMSGPLFEAPRAFDQRIYLAFPTYFSDLSARGRADYRDLAERHALPPDHVQAQIAALAAARLLVEGLQRAGRELSRVRLVAALEALYAFETGLTPPLSYGPNRRIGARGAHIVAVDLVNRTYAVVDGGFREVR